jgi:very-short-patch-repair endonuclease
MKKHPPPRNIPRARQLRREMTDAERAMWRLLREVAPGARWRKQGPLRHYIVDFASHRVKLVVEVDGGQHSEEADAERTAIVQAEGYQVLRFWNYDVLGNAEGCARVLSDALAARSPPSNSG